MNKEKAIEPPQKKNTKKKNKIKPRGTTGGGVREAGDVAKLCPSLEFNPRGKNLLDYIKEVFHKGN